MPQVDEIRHASVVWRKTVLQRPANPPVTGRLLFFSDLVGSQHEAAPFVPRTGGMRQPVAAPGSGCNNRNATIGGMNMISLCISDSEGAGRIDITVLGYEHSSPQSLDDANWLSCEISARSHGFSCTTSAGLRTQEFKIFLLELQACVLGGSHTACFENMEDWILIRADFSFSGCVKIKCTVTEQFRSRASMSFLMDVNKDKIVDILNALERVVSTYPERLSMKAD